MTQRGFPFDAGEGLAYELDWSKMARQWLTNGIIPNVGSELGVFGDSTGMQVKVPAGDAWVRGHYYTNDAQVIQVLTAANPSNPRIDRIVLRIDYTANTIRIAALAGTPAASPVAPALTQTDSIYEYSLATVLVAAGVGTIAAGAVTSTRNYISGAQANEPGPLTLNGADASIRQIRTGSGDYQLIVGANSIPNQYGLYNSTAGRYEWLTSSSGVMALPNGAVIYNNSAGGYPLILRNESVAGISGAVLHNNAAVVKSYIIQYNGSYIGNNSFSVSAAGTMEVSSVSIPLYVGTTGAFGLFFGTNSVVRASFDSAGVFSVVNAAVFSGTGAASGSGLTVSSNGATIIGLLNISGTTANFGPNGATNPTFKVNGSVASAVTGLQITGRASAGGVDLETISPGTNENLRIDAKGSGTITFGTNSTGATIFNQITTFVSRAQWTTNAIGTVGAIYKDAAAGLAIRGITGSTADLTLLNNGNTDVLQVVAGTQIVNFPGTITIASGPRLRALSVTVLAIRDNADSAYADLDINALTVRGNLTESGLININGAHSTSSSLSIQNTSAGQITKLDILDSGGTRTLRLAMYAGTYILAGVLGGQSGISGSIVEISSSSAQAFYIGTPSGGGILYFSTGGIVRTRINSTGFTVFNDFSAEGNVALGNATTDSIGFFGSAGTTKPAVAGAKAGNAALTSLMSALANMGLVTDNTT